MTERRRLVKVPATSANLGPGYDVLAAALSLHLELEVTETGKFSVDAGGTGAPETRENLCVRAFEMLHPADGLRFEMRSEIPIAAGLGSSAAAIIAGLMAAEHLYELAIDHDGLLAKAVELEGHPDNVAAALFGGFVACSMEDGVPRATRFDPPEGVEGVLVIPGDRFTTNDARGALPPEIPLGDVVANIAAATELVLGIERADLTLIGRGLRDRVHQPRRAHIYPRSMEIVAEAGRLGAIGATISGAGPSVLVWTFWQSTGKVVDAIKQRVGGWAEVRRAPFTPLGADVPEL
jgi:homoserine kinase